jgi:tripartite-type tricarboxylate transporter receptor subunit TctC
MLPRLALAVAAVIAGLVPYAPRPAGADPVADFYKGKTVTILVATDAGSAYDIHARLLADRMEKVLPGNPNFIVQYMAGAGGAKMANYLYNVAPKDGTLIGFPLKYIAVNQVLGRPGLKYDAAQLGYIGSIGPINSVVALWKATAPATSIDDMRAKEVVVGSSGKSSETYITPTLMNHVLGTRFKIVMGYTGMSALDLATEKGEVHGRAGSWESLKSGKEDWLAEKKVALVAQSGIARAKDLPDVPTLIELGKTTEDKQILEFFALGNAVGWLFVTPPGVPAERIAAMRTAFDTVMADKNYQADLVKHRLDHDPFTGAELEAMIRKTLAQPPDTAKKLAEIAG